MSERHKRLDIFLLCLISDLALLSAEREAEEEIILPLALAAAAIVAWFLPRIRISKNRLNLIAIAGFAFFVVEAITRRELKVLALTHYLIFIQAIFFIQELEMLERYLLVMTSLFQFLVASILTEELVYMLFFLAYVAFSIPTLLAMGWRALGKDWPELTRGLKVQASALLLLLLAPLLVTLFIVFPRFNLGLLGKMDIYDYGRTGFSTIVRLGSLSTLLEDETVVMTVKGPVLKRPYLRVIAYDTYSHRQWLQRNKRLEPVPRTGENLFLLDEEAGATDSYIAYEITLNSFKNNVLPLPYQSMAVRYPAPSLSRDFLETVYLPSYPATELKYTAYCRHEAAPPPDRTTDMADLESGRAPAFALNVEDGLKSLLRPLALKIVGNETGELSRVELIRTYLLENYRYSLSHRMNTTMDPVEHFLFYAKSGYCEYFATSFTLLLRSIGIPAILAGGFLVREPLPTHDGYVVRQRDSHTWTEVFFPGQGWVSFDATPSTPPVSGESFAFKLSQVRRMIETRFRLAIIEYTRSRQLIFLRNLTSRLSAARAAVQSFLDKIAAAGKEYLHAAAFGVIMAALGVAAIIVLSVAAIALRRQIRHAFRERRLYGPEVRTVRRYYRRAVRRLGRKGWKATSAMTPEELVALVQRDDPPAALAAQSLFEQYEAARFGGRAIDERRLELLMRELKTTLRR